MEQQFKVIIKPNYKWYNINIREIMAYRDLLFLFVKRDFTTRYKQTILGPLWLVITPVVTTLISTFVFGTIAGIPSDSVPYFLFYMCGSTIWTYFSSCLTVTSSIFTGNAGIFGKVYFPRLIVPFANVLTGMLDFFIKFLIFAAFWICFYLNGAKITLTWALAIVPILVIQMAMLGLGCGIIISSLTTKYRDLTVLVGFGISMWMYISPIIYSTSSLTTQLRKLCMLNPVSPVVELFRYAFLGTGDVSMGFWAISIFITLIVFAIGVVLFNRVEKTFMDTV